MEQFDFREEKQNKCSDSTNVSGPSLFSYTDAQEKSGNQELRKALRRPRSKKRMKILSKLDIPSMTDLEIMEKMREEAGGELDEAAVTQEDISSYLARIREEFEAMVQRDLEAAKKAEEEKKRFDEVSARQEEELRNSIMEYTLSKCYIRGCTIHSITYDKIEHYKKTEIPQHMLKVFDFYKSVKKCEYVEVYPKLMVAVSKQGEVLEMKDI